MTEPTSESTSTDSLRVMADSNATDHDLEEPRFVHELIESQAERTPEAIALVFEGESFSYLDLDTHANRLASELRRRGVGRGSIVAIHMDRSIELLVALLGVLKAGAAYAPLDPTHPPARLALLAADLSTSVVLTRPNTPAHFAGSAETLVVDRAALESFPATKPALTLGGDDLAYVIYTSGSTGTPKGVMSTHQGMRNRLLWKQSRYPITSEDTVLQKTPYTFDVSVWELFWPLMFGARLVIAKPDGHRDPLYIARTIREQRVTVAHFIPSMLALFMESYEPGSTPALRRVVCSGEALPRAMQDRFFERVGCALSNFYGPTEASIDVSYWDCNAKDPPGEVPIGRPIFNTQLWVVDRDGEPCPIGVPGELMIGGIGVARGYLKRPELSAESFVPDPFSKEPGARMYRTGDLARWRADGAIDYLGRIDHQVKIRGLRVELGEIETALSACAGVVTAAVLARDLPDGDKQLVGYIVAQEGVVLEAAALARSLAETLPSYMVPNVFVPMTRLPLTSSGKVDRVALPGPEARSAPAAEGAASPTNEIETTIAEMWCALLRIDAVGVDDDFFSLGGHSLLLAQLAVRIKKELDVELSLAALFDALTVRQMSELVAEQLANLATDDVEMAALLAEVEGLSEAEAKALLEADGG